jgi:Cu2+-exporting ATPase/Cu+-exporting ATPase
VQTWDWLVAQSARDEIRSAVYSIESRSAHPIATALVDSLGNQAGVHLIAVEGHQEMPGLGVSGRAAGHDIRIARLPDCPSDGATWLGVWADGNLAARVALRDELRAETPEILRRIRRHWTVTILSGDGRAAVSALADRLALSPDDTRAEVSPEEKARIVARQPNSLMIGDGANDALALARARVGVAVQGSLEVSIRAADVVLLRSGLAPLLRLLTIARETRRVLHRNYAFSIAYNALGAYLALKGTIGPLFAAVVMPASAMTVFLSSAIGTRRLRGDT